MTRPWQLRVHTLLPLTTAVLLLLLLPPASCSPSVIPYTTIGPAPSNGGYGVYALTQAYNVSMQPFNASRPTVSIGLSLTANGDASVSSLVQALQFMVDITNFRGGVRIGGEQYNTAVTFTTDDGSSVLVRYAYEEMFASAAHAMYFAPDTDVLLQAVLPILPASNATLLSPGNQDPADFTSGYPNLFALLNTADALWIAALDGVNAQAQSWAQAGGAGSVNGIKTVCLFSEVSVLLQAALTGVRQWIEAENTRRLNADNITVLVDTTWNETVTGTYLDYAAVLLQCPDDTDLMVLQPSFTSGLDVAHALQASQLRPKAVIGLSSITSGLILAADDTAPIAAVLAGWVVPLAVTLADATISAHGGVFFSVYDMAYAAEVWGAAVQANLLQNLNFAYWTAWGVMMAALTRTNSLSQSDLREAILGLNGQTSAFISLEFDNVTGINVAQGALISQVNAVGLLVDLNSSAEILYPYDWPWHPVQVGDAIHSSQSNSSILLSVVICVIGAWVALIIVEQSVFVRRSVAGPRYVLWLAVTAGSLGGVSVWCCQLMVTTALSVSKTAGGAALSVRYSLDVAFLAWLPSLILTWAGLVVLMGDVDGRAQRNRTISKSTEAQRTLLMRREEKKKRAALSNHDHFYHLLRSISWRVVVGGWMVAAGMIVTRITIWYVWAQDATFKAAAWTWVVTILLDAIFVPIAMLMFFHALRWRVMAVFLFACCVLQDWFLSQQGISWYLAASASSTTDTLSTEIVDSTVIQMIAGIIAAFICFIFVGLQFSRMQLSRNGLSVLVASLEHAVNARTNEWHAEQKRSAALREHRDYLLKVVQCINLLTPVPQEYALCLAMTATSAAFDAVSDSADTEPLSGVVHGTHSRSSPGKDLVQNIASRSRAPAAAAADAVTRVQPPAHSPASSSVHPVAQSGAETAVQKAEAASKRAVAEPSQEVSVSQDNSEQDAERGGAARDADNVEQALGGNAADSSADTVSEQADDDFVAQPAPMASPHPRSSDVSKRGHQSVTSDRVAAGEDELHKLLQLQLASHHQDELLKQTQPGGPRARTRSVSQPTGVNAEFDLSSPLLPSLTGAAEAKDVARRSLSNVLKHPVCVELIKTELLKIHSGEILAFYLQVQQYKSIQRQKTRKLLAAQIANAFIRDGSPQQININTRQREAIMASIALKSDDSCPPELFREAERECLLLMDTNLWKHFVSSAQYRLCLWLCRALAPPYGASKESSAAGEVGASEKTTMTGSLLGQLLDPKSSNRSKAAW